MIFAQQRRSQCLIAIVMVLLFLIPSTSLAQLTADEYIESANARLTAIGSPPLTPLQQTRIRTATTNLSEREWEFINARNAARVANGNAFMSGPEIATSLAGTSFNSLSPEEQEVVIQQQKDEAANPSTKKEPSTSCWSTTGSLGEFGKCLWHSFMAFIGSIPVAIGALFLTIAGKLFNWLVDNTIMQFSSAIYSKAQVGIEAGWATFRDISNILIIGMFVFISISLILGLKDYGNKKLVANVLIIAVLINFSLLFTKLIIDASNFTAFQFYKAASIPSTTTGTNINISDQGLSENTLGVAGSFMYFMGVTSLGDTYNAVFKVAQKQDSGWVAVGYGLLAGILLFAAALVFFYGSYLLLTRAILLIFLLVTSSLAFASYLVPKLSAKGWTVWWSSLIRNAIFAPLLMLFLWVTLIVASKIHAVGGGLGNLATDQNASLGIQALFNYLIILGLLFASFKISANFAGTIGGFGNIGGLLQYAGGFGLAAAARGAGMAGRKFIGGNAASRLDAMKTQIYENEGREATRGELRRMRALNWMSRKSFDMGNVKTVKGVFGSSSSMATSDVGKKGYAGVKAEQAKNAMDIAKQISLSDTQRQAVVDARLRAAAMAQQPARERTQNAQQMYEANRDNAERMGQHETQAVESGQFPQRDAIRQAVEASQQDLRGDRQQLETERDRYDQQIRMVEARINSAQDAALNTSDPDQLRRITGARVTAEGELATLNTARTNTLADIQRRIDASERNIEMHNQTIENLDRQADAAGRAVTENERRWAERRLGQSRQVLQGMDDALTQLSDDSRQALGIQDGGPGQGGVAQRIGHDRAAAGFGAVGTLASDPVAGTIRDLWRAQQRRQTAQDILADLGITPQPPPTANP